MFRLLLIGLLLAFAVAAHAAGSRPERVRLYVSPAGDDAWTGSLAAANAARSDGPVATLAGARDRLRKLRAGGPGLARGALVEVQAGVYEMKQPLALTAGDSGTREAPVAFQARGEARLVGGKVIGGWRPVTDLEVLKRLDPTARGKVMQTDLQAQGVTDFGKMESAAVWAQSDPGLELFFRDKPMILARWPNEGYTHIADIAVKDGHNIFGIEGSRAAQFVYEGDRPARWVGEKDIMVHGYWFWDWADQRYRVAGIDAQTKQMALEGNPHGFGFRKGQWYYAYNLLCELDQPGEWYLDRDRGILYFWPPAPLSQGKAMVSVTRGLLDMKDVEHVSFRGFTLECGRGNAVVIEGGADVRLEACTLRNIGANAVVVTNGRHHGVEGCDIYQTGDGGVSLTGGDRATLTPAGHYADNNHIHHCSRWNPLYHQGINLQGVGNRATHNLIDNLPHIAIGFAGNDQVIEYNEIHSVCTQANDNGAVYTSPPDEDWSMRGHRIRFNYLHDMYGFEGKGCSGVYLDDLFSSALIYGNVFVRVSNPILIGGGRDNIIENNVFYRCPRAFSIDARGLGWLAGAKDWMPALLKQWPYQGPIWSARYPELVNVLADEPLAPKGNRVLRNICWEGPWGGIEGAAVPYVEVKDNLIGEDPRFADAAKGDFRLKAGSPGLRVGFEQVPMTKMGVYRSRNRASWPVTSRVAVTPPPPPPPAPTPHSMPPYTAKRVTRTPQVDGTLSSGEWPELAMVLKETSTREAITGQPARAWVCHDGKLLHVAVSVPVEDVAKLRRDDKWGGSDGVEVAFRDASGTKPGTIFGVRGFVTGKFESYTDAGATPEQAKRLGAAVRFAASGGEKGWTCEWAIPLEAAGLKPRPGLRLGFNVGVMRSEQSQWLVWCGALGETWRLENAGRVVLQ